MNLVGEIKWYLGEDDYARLRYSEDRHGFFIETVLVPARYRNQGIGSELVRHVLAMADALGKNTRVSARPIGNATEENLQRLVGFYSRFGFTVEDRGMTIVYMVRLAASGNGGDQRKQ